MGFTVFIEFNLIKKYSIIILFLLKSIKDESYKSYNLDLTLKGRLYLKFQQLNFMFNDPSGVGGGCGL